MSNCLQRYIDYYHEKLIKNARILRKLKKLGIGADLVDSYSLGYSDASLVELVRGNHDLEHFFEQAGIIKSGKEMHGSSLVVPIYHEDGTVENIAFCKLGGKKEVSFVNDQGVFNRGILIENAGMVLTASPLECLRLIVRGVTHATFYSGNVERLVTFSRENRLKRFSFAMDGHATLFASLVVAGLDGDRVELNAEGTINIEAIASLASSCRVNGGLKEVEEIERGLLFRFDPLSYRVVGDFKDQSLTLKVNIKAYTDKDVFLDSIDLYRNRDRVHFICNLMETFKIREKEFLQADLNRIIESIEEHCRKRKEAEQAEKDILTDDEKAEGLRFLKNPDMIDELTADIDRLGYVRERKNKILLYLVMTSRLMDNPLHALIVSRSGAGKSQLVEIMERLCPADEAVVMSDLSDQALYYVGRDALRHKFVVIGEKEGSKGSEYPLRELISKKTITKAVPVKDHSTGLMKTTSVTVNGPISLVETTTDGEVNPENLNRCFVIGIDESEEQTEAIQECQRLDDTLEGFLERTNEDSTLIKHHAAQKQLRHVKVFNPFAPLLTFPKSRLAMRRDHDKFLKLIKAVCFLRQYHREVKSVTLANGEVVDYIECTVDDYRVAYDLLADGILDYTLDDLPRPTRELFKLIKAYLESVAKGPLDSVMFTRKDIRDHTGWSFAQVRNNIMKLKEYEYIKVVRSKTGTADQYTLNGSYEGLDFQHTILTPEQLEERIRKQAGQKSFVVKKKKVVVANK